MILRFLLGAGAAGLLYGAALAQTAPAPAATLNAHPADGFKHMSAAELAALVDKPGAGPITGLLSDHENWYSQIVARNAPGQVEVHAHWIDVMSVLSGNATITYGGTVTGGQETAPGEMRGGAISGGTVVEVHPGDYLQIPAGVPHLTVPAPGAAFRVLVVKQRY